ncbi:Hypothetical predicted protein [Olea europaea subsp. europaea]|uniref:DUF1985 domain-containing protein n=1 Tax=Olea europaea subsp. europaea TaxID=158383 RepID=A0A8S0RN70_OLEEU|nr:Hypothetical predicted protein [Olea europaea subsp. europaea]
MTLPNILVVFGVYGARKFIFSSDAFISYFIFADMDFKPLVPENAHLRDHVSDLQFSAQLIQQLVFCCIRADKRQELWFNLQSHLARFDIQEYAHVTGLRCGLLPDDNFMERVLDKRRLKDKYFKHVDKISCAQLEQTFLRLSMPQADWYKLGLALIIEESSMLRIIMLIWAFEAMLEIGDLFGRHLDDLAKDNVAPQFHAERLGTPAASTSKDDTSDTAHEGSGTSGKEEESRVNDSEEAEGEDSEDHDSGDSDGDRVRQNYGSFADYAGYHPSPDDPNKDIGINRGPPPSTGDRDEEQDMLPTRTEHLQELSLDNDPVLVSAGIDEVQDPSFIKN